MRWNPPHPRRALAPLAATLMLALCPGWSLADGEPASEAATIAALAEGRIVAAEDLGVGVTFPLRMSLEHEGRRLRGVFKDVELHAPHRGEGPDPFVADRWSHEVAAYRLDRMLGLGLVPVTVVREYEGRKGSLQVWIDGASSLADADREESASLRTMRRFFDALIFNPDRNPGNILVAAEGGRDWLIDHSRAFRAVTHLPWSLGSKPVVVPDTLRASLEALDREALVRELGELLAPAQIDALLVRRSVILEQAP